MKRLTCFSKRDFGEIILMGVGVAELLLALLLCLSLKLNEKMLVYGVAACTFIFGMGYVFAYFANARTRFRPCWYLPLGMFLAFIGGGAIALGLLRLPYPSVSITSIVVLLGVASFILSLSNSFQLKSLCLSRWLVVAFFAVMELEYASVLYFMQNGKIEEIMGLCSKPLRGVAVFLVILALQTVFEAAIVFNKKTKSDN